MAAIKGYGFLAPDSGGEDVFIHVNGLYSDKSLLVTGSIVEFRLDEGDRLFIRRGVDRTGRRSPRCLPA